MANRWGNSGNSGWLYFLGSKITADVDCSHEIKRHLLLGRNIMTNLDSILKSRGITLPTSVHLVKAMVFPVFLYGCESWTVKKAECWRIECFWTVVLEKTLESPLDCKEIQPVHLKGNQSWIFIGRTDVEVETVILWPPNSKNWLIGKDPDSGQDWRQEEKGITEDEMFGWHHWLYGHEFEQAPGAGMDMCAAWHAAVRGVTKNRTQLGNWTELRGRNYSPQVIPQKEQPSRCSVAGRAGSNLSSQYPAVRGPAEPFLCYFQFHLKPTSLNATQYYQAICAYVLSRLSHAWLSTPWTVAHQAPASLGFSRQEYDMGCHVLLQGIFPTPGRNACLLRLLICRQILYCWGTG